VNFVPPERGQYRRGLASGSCCRFPAVLAICCIAVCFSVAIRFAAASVNTLFFCFVHPNCCGHQLVAGARPCVPAAFPETTADFCVRRPSIILMDPKPWSTTSSTCFITIRQCFHVALSLVLTTCVCQWSTVCVAIYYYFVFCRLPEKGLSLNCLSPTCPNAHVFFSAHPTYAVTTWRNNLLWSVPRSMPRHGRPRTTVWCYRVTVST